MISQLADPHGLIGKPRGGRRERASLAVMDFKTGWKKILANPFLPPFSPSRMWLNGLTVFFGSFGCQLGYIDADELPSPIIIGARFVSAAASGASLDNEARHLFASLHYVSHQQFTAIIRLLLLLLLLLRIFKNGFPQLQPDFRVLVRT